MVRLVSWAGRPVRRRGRWVSRRQCDECLGDGLCSSCAGHGHVYTRHGAPACACVDCGSSGACPECDGRGLVRAPVELIV